MTRLTRRRLLHATGLASGSLFLPSLLGDRRAQAAAATPGRMAILFTQHGPTYETWRMRPQASLPDKDSDWEFSLDTVAEADWSQVLQPLYAYRKNIIVLDGLAMTSAFADNPGTNNHNAGTSHALPTGAKMVRGSGFNGEGRAADRRSIRSLPTRWRYRVGSNRSSIRPRTGLSPCPSFEASNKPTTPNARPPPPSIGCSPRAQFPIRALLRRPI